MLISGKPHSKHAETVLTKRHIVLWALGFIIMVSFHYLVLKDCSMVITFSKVKGFVRYCVTLVSTEGN